MINYLNTFLEIKAKKEKEEAEKEKRDFEKWVRELEDGAADTAYESERDNRTE